ncbi:Hypothetical predicted protein, partial [Olea europaea subsp. europaea]
MLRFKGTKAIFEQNHCKNYRSNHYTTTSAAATSTVKPPLTPQKNTQIATTKLRFEGTQAIFEQSH